MDNSSAWPSSDDRQLIIDTAAGKNVIWDFDGTIADTEDLHEDSFRAVLADREFHLPEEYFMENFGGAEEEIWRVFKDDHGAPIDSISEVVEERMLRYIQIAAAADPSWFVRDLAPALDEVGAAQYVLSNGHAQTNSELIRRYGYDGILRSVERNGRDKCDFYEQLRPAVLLDDRSQYLGMAGSSVR